jgi:hypothetical protein
MRCLNKSFTLSLTVLAALLLASASTAQASPNPPGYTGGGVWVHPIGTPAQWGFEPMTVEVRVTNSSQVNHINFTANWPESGGWRILCRDAVSSPDSNTYTCKFGPQAAGVPPLADFSLSFDVYGSLNDQLPDNLAPNGVHHVSWGWGCVYVPGSGGCNNW